MEISAEYLWDITECPSERLAAMARDVRSPFTEHHYSRQPDSDILYAIKVKDLGEWLASWTVILDQPELSSKDVMLQLRANASNRLWEHADQFLGDEIALAHAAQVYRFCVDEFDTYPERFTPAGAM